MTKTVRVPVIRANCKHESRNEDYGGVCAACAGRGWVLVLPDETGAARPCTHPTAQESGYKGMPCCLGSGWEALAERELKKHVPKGTKIELIEK